MKYVSLIAADMIHKCAVKKTLTYHPVAASSLRKLSQTIRHFRRQIDHEVDLPNLRSFSVAIQKVCFKLCAAPVYFDHPSINTDWTKRAISRVVETCDLLYPSHAENIRTLVRQLDELAKERRSPLLEYMENHVGELFDDRTVVLIKERSLIPAVEDIFSRSSLLRDIPVVSQEQLSTDTCFNSVLVVGSLRWFPDYVVSAPRAMNIHVVSYRWISNSPREPLSFIDPIQEIPAQPAEPVVQNGEIEPIDARELLPTINWDALKARGQKTSDTTGAEEQVEAYIVSLEGDYGVFLDAAEGSKVRTIDITDVAICHTTTSTLSEGMYILLRTEGGGDLIVPIADTILADRAIALREGQKLWKDRLRFSSLQRGITQIAVDLLDYGSIKANEQNVRNWMSYRSIKTADRRDFDAIMRVTELHDRSDELWRNAVAIDSAHRIAARHIARMLGHQVREANLHTLEKCGKMDFELPGVGGGKLTAFRINKIAKETWTVPVSRLNRPLRMDD